MSDKAWRELVKRYADGRQICNCDMAYYSPVGRGIDTNGVHRNDLMVCAHGCSANQCTARNEIAGRVLDDLKNMEHKHG